mmetsp:Transcript_26091/g.83268  ORF Transcript_26091/g.83268 Transcript_26091/m.83268 type:complete len:227 (+) Transcript_26091:592-1272(+)
MALRQARTVAPRARDMVLVGGAFGRAEGGRREWRSERGGELKPLSLLCWGLQLPSVTNDTRRPRPGAHDSTGTAAVGDTGREHPLPTRPLSLVARQPAALRAIPASAPRVWLPTLGAHPSSPRPAFGRAYRHLAELVLTTALVGRPGPARRARGRWGTTTRRGMATGRQLGRAGARCGGGQRVRQHVPHPLRIGRPHGGGGANVGGRGGRGGGQRARQYGPPPLCR